MSRLLTGLCTNTAPPDAWRQADDLAARERLRSPHVPQGAPTSPALANLCAYRLDCRLAALAGAVGARYTRYADDLAFSGGEALERVARRFHVAVCRIALEEGFEVHTRKSRFMRQGVRQQLAGVVLNVRPNVRRDRYDELKAILTNCVRRGPQGRTARVARISRAIFVAGSLTSQHSTRSAVGGCCDCSSKSTGRARLRRSLPLPYSL